MGKMVQRIAVRFEHDLIIIVDPEPFHAFNEELDGALHGARDIGIFDTQNECAARVARIEPVKEGGAIAADVLVAGWTGSEAQAWLAIRRQGILLLWTIVGLCHKRRKSPLHHTIVILSHRA